MTIVPDIERQPADVIKRFQEAKLREALRYVAAHSAFYRRLFREHGVDPERVHRIEDLTVIPFTEKSDLQLHNEEFVCVPRARIIDYITTSGTLGDPVTFAMTDADLDRLAYNEQISFACTGAGPGSVFQLMTTIDKRFMAGLAYFLGIRRLGAGIVRVGNGIPELQWDTIRRVRPDTIIVVPSFIPRIIDYAEAHGIDYHASSVRRAVCIGENLREQDFSLNLLGESIRRRWDIELFSTYASTEMATTFTECPCGCGGHHHPELIICELIGDDGLPVADDEAGGGGGAPPPGGGGGGWPGLDEPFGGVVSVEPGDNALAELLHHEVDRMRVPASVNAALVLVAVDRFEYFDGFVDAGRD